MEDDLRDAKILAIMAHIVLLRTRQRDVVLEGLFAQGCFSLLFSLSLPVQCFLCFLKHAFPKAPWVLAAQEKATQAL